MALLKWDQPNERLYETGVKNVVLFKKTSSGTYGTGVAWNGVTAITESPSGAEPTPLYADDTKYLTLVSAEEFGATIEAYMYPDEWAECDGSATLAKGVTIGQQPRVGFGLAYITTVGSDGSANAGEKIHIIYGGMAATSERAYSTINDSPEAITFSWEITTTPVEVSGAKPTSIITIDSLKVNDSTKIQALKDMLFGTDAEGSSEGTDPTLPTPAQLKTMFATTQGGSV